MVRLLHVDDDSGDQELTEFNMRRHDKEIRVDCAESGRQALEMLAGAEYDAVLSDYQMPGMNGLELLSELRNRGDETPFIFLTGQGNEEIAARALREGANDYFTKEAGFAHYDRLINSLRRNIAAKAQRDKHITAGNRISRLNQVLQAVRNINQLITKEIDINRVLSGACETLIETRGYHCAWIAILGDEQRFAKVVGAGPESGMKEFREELLAEKDIECANAALKQAEVIVLESTDESCTGCPLADREKSQGSLVVRLEHADKVYGVMAVSLDAEVVIDREEQDLYAELAADIAFALHRDGIISAHQAAEQALRESEARVRVKLDSILSPKGDIGALELSDIIDAPVVQSMMDDFFKLTKIAPAILDLRGNILVATGWQDICTQFHRIHPQASKFCTESDLVLSRGVEQGEFRIYKCKNNMWDIATPIIVGGKHLGNLYLGQFFFDDEEIDYEAFRSQARKFGFDEEEYLAALERVPRWSLETVNTVMTFYTKLAGVISDLSYSNIKLARTLVERDGLLNSLRQREALLNTTQGLTRIGGWEWDVEKQTMYWTDEVYRIHDFEQGEIAPGMAKHIARSLECYDPEDRPVILAAFQRCVEEGREYDLEFPFTTAKGRRLWIRTTAQPVMDGGKTVRVVGTIMDVTERKQAEGAYRTSRQALENLMSNLPGMVYRCRNDENWTMEFVSDGCKELTGYPSDDVIDNRKISFAEIIAADDRERIWAEVPAALEARHPFKLTYRILTIDGEEKWVWEMGRGIFDSNGELEALEGFVMDISDRIRMEEALRHGEERLKGILNSMPVGIFLIDVESARIVESNPAAAEMIGVSEDEVRGRSCRDFIGLNCQEYLEIDRGDVIQHSEDILADANGNEIPIIRTAVVFKLGGRKHILEAFINISERKRFEKQMQQSRDQLAATNKELEAFSYSVSHDLQSPLRHIEGFSRLLMDDYADRLDDEGRDYLGRVREAASRMSLLINDLLKLSRSTRGELNRRKVDLSKLALEISERLRKEDPGRAAEIKIHPGLVAEVDGGMVRVVLENLLGNAWKFTGRKRKTEIEFGRAEVDGRKAFFVRDNGSGFKAGDAGKLFVPFKRLHSEEEFAGSGIGLATVQRIIHRHGGRVWAEGREDKGAVFYFTLS